MQGDDTIGERLALFEHQREVLREQMEQLQRTMDVLDYKCWYYETAREAGSVGAVQQLDAAQIPERFRSVRGELRSAPGADKNSKETEGEIA